MMKHLTFILSLLLIAAAGISFYGCATADAARMPISVAPFYKSDPLTINVGDMSEQLKSDNPGDILKLANSIKPGDTNIPIEALYVMAIRLYDLDEKIPAAYWFYNAQLKSKILNDILAKEAISIKDDNDITEKLDAYEAFNELMEPYFNNVLSENPEGWTDIINMVQKDLTNFDVRGFVNDFPKIADKIINEHPEAMQKLNEGLNAIKDILQENVNELVQQTKNKR